MGEWTYGQLTIADFLPIRKPENTISIKAYLPSYELQGETEEIEESDIKRWDSVRNSIIQRFMTDFHYRGTYRDNKLNRRLGRTGRPYYHSNMLGVIDITNDEQLTSVQIVLNTQPSDRRDVILGESFGRSENVNELEENTPVVAREVDGLVRGIRTRWRMSPSMTNPYTGNPVTVSELARVRDGILWGAEWFR